MKKLDKVYQLSNDWIEVLKVSGISADEYSKEEIETTGKLSRTYNGIIVTTTKKDREDILEEAYTGKWGCK